MPNGFLRSWVARHVKGVKATERSKEAKRLAGSCMADGMMAGIPPDQLAATAGGNLVTYMAKAIDTAIAAEVDRTLERVKPKNAGNEGQT